MAKYIEFSGLKREQFQVKSNLKNVLQSVKYCGFCLEKERDLFWLKDYSRFDKDISFCTLERMVEKVFGAEIVSNITSGYVCALCKENVEQSYIFISKVRKTFEILSHYLNQIDLHIIDVANMITESNRNDFVNTVIVLQDTDEDNSVEVIPLCEKDVTSDGATVDTSQSVSDNNNLALCTEEYIIEEVEAINSYVCEHCFQMFKSKSTLWHHISTSHRSKMREAIRVAKKEMCLECKTVPCIHENYLNSIEVCKKTQSEYDSSTVHIKCIDCDYVCNQKSSLLAHVNKMHLNNRPYLCENCGESFHSRQSHYSHMKSLHSHQINVCQHCDAEIEDKAELFNHVIQCRTVEREFKCDACVASFDNEKQLSVHLENHNKHYSCHICLRTFNEVTRFNKHRALAHKSCKTQKNRRTTLSIRGKIERVCSICFEKFDSLPELRRHVRLHDPDEKHKCHDCHLTFDTRLSYQKHIRSSKHIHKIDPNASLSMQCPECDYTCETRRYMEHHMNVVHLKIKPYVCDVCQKTFTTKYNLKSHVDLHTGIKRHRCSCCDSRFSTTTGLKKHVFSQHRHDKPLACELCEKTFLYMSEYELHKQRSHSLRNVACPLCRTKFTAISNVRRHIMSVHAKGRTTEEFLKSEYSKELAELLRDRRLPVIEP